MTASCLTATDCWSADVTNLSALPQCFTQCVTAGGITSQSAPGAPMFGALLICAQDPSSCGPVCAPMTDP
jgi:hypothetical protein